MCFNDHDEEKKSSNACLLLSFLQKFQCKKKRSVFKMSFKELAIKNMRLNRRWGRRRGTMVGVREKVSL